MNTDEYGNMIRDAVRALKIQTLLAVNRNRFKDERFDHGAARGWGDDGPTPTVFMVKGWAGFDLSAKLKEEVAEVLKNPSPEEIGDVAWVLAMMLDQLKEVGV